MRERKPEIVRYLDFVCFLYLKTNLFYISDAVRLWEKLEKEKYISSLPTEIEFRKLCLEYMRIKKLKSMILILSDQP